MYLDLYQSELFLFVASFVLIIGVIGYHEYKDRVTAKQVSTKVHSTNLTDQIIEVLEQFDQWLLIADTKEALMDLLYNLNEFTTNTFNNRIQFNITKDEFNRMSVDQVKAFITQLLDQIRNDVMCENEPTVRADYHQ